MSHNSPTWKELIERYGKVARSLIMMKDDPDKDRTEDFASLYQYLGLKDVMFDHEGFDFFKKKFAESVQISGFRIKLELVDFHVVVKVRPAWPHEATSQALHGLIFEWLINRGLGDRRALLPVASAEWTYDAQGHKREPDDSWIPRDIDPLLPGVLMIPGTNQVYPTLVVEVGYRHETYPELLRDAAAKHFSPLTSIQLYVGVKIHRETRRYQVFAAERLPGQQGGLQGIFETPGLIPVDIPTQLAFTLPSRLLFFGVPPHLVPQTAIPDLIVPVDEIRWMIQRYL